MLFPQEIFRMIMRHHKILTFGDKMKYLIDHRINNQELCYIFFPYNYSYRIKEFHYYVCFINQEIYIYYTWTSKYSGKSLIFIEEVIRYF